MVYIYYELLPDYLPMVFILLLLLLFLKIIGLLCTVTIVDSRQVCRLITNDFTPVQAAECFLVHYILNFEYNVATYARVLSLARMSE